MSGSDGRSVLEVIRAVARTTGRTTLYLVGDRRAGAPQPGGRTGPSPKRLGWSPAYTDLDQIVRSAVAWRVNPRFGPIGRLIGRSHERASGALGRA